MRTRIPDTSLFTRKNYLSSKPNEYPNIMDLLILWILQSLTFFRYLLRTILNARNVTLDSRDFVTSAFFTRNKATIQPGFEIRKLCKALYLSLITIKPSTCLRVRGKLKNVKLHRIHQSIRDIQNIIVLWYLVDEGNFVTSIFEILFIKF